MSARRVSASSDDRTPSTDGGGGPAGKGPARMLLFRLIALMGVPSFLFGGIELALRLSGVGHSTSFFIRRTVGGRHVYTENPNFGLRFFPPELARAPSALVMPVDKPANRFRIFILGESAALGDPEPAFGFGRYLEALIRDRNPSADVEVICTAMTAINSHAILPIARDCARRDGDLWVVYMGNNEFVGPFGPSSAFGSAPPGLAVIRATLALRQLRLVQWLETALRRWKGYRKGPASWGGMKMFLDHQVGPQDPRKAQVYESFQKNVEAILDIAARAGVPVVLSTVASNLKDCPPFASSNFFGLSPTSTALGKSNFEKGWAAYEARDYNGIPGRELLYEHVHLNSEGNYHLALAVVNAALPFLGNRRFGASSMRGDASFEECSRHLGLSDWDRRRVYENILHRFQEPPFANRKDFAPLVEGIRRDLADVRSRLTPDTARNARAQYQQAVKAWPNDFYLAGNYAKFLEDTGEIDEAMVAWGRVGELLPFEAAPYFYQGKLLARQKKTDPALAALSKALEIRPDIPDALDEKGRLLLGRRQWDEGLGLIQQALRLQPGNAKYCLHLADGYATQGNRSEALAYLRQAVAVQPDSWEAHYYLGVELASREALDETRQHFAEVVRLRPEHPLGHFNLAIALAKSGQTRAAATQLEETLRLDPQNTKAAQYLKALRRGN